MANKNQRIFDLTSNSRSFPSLNISNSANLKKRQIRGKRKIARAPNFSKIEEKILYSLMRKYKVLFEIRLNDSESSKKKNAAWNLLTNDYNLVVGSNESGVYRDQHALKTKCHNIKKEIRRKARMTAAAAGREIGEIDINEAIRDHGDFVTEEEGDISMAWLLDEDIEEGNEDLRGWDDGTTIVKEEINLMRDESEGSFIEDESNDDTEDVGRQTGYLQTSARTEEPLEPEIRFNYPLVHDVRLNPNEQTNESSRQNGESDIDRTKHNLEDIWKRIYLEDHAVKLAQMRERHELEMQIRKEEWELKKQFLKDEHNAKLSKLSAGHS